MAIRPDTQRVMGTEEAMALGIVEMLDIKDQKIKTLTDLNDTEIGVLTLLDIISQRLRIKEVGNFVKGFCQFRVSKYRLGRREMANIITFAGFGTEERRKVRSIRDLFSGMR